MCREKAGGSLKLISDALKEMSDNREAWERDLNRDNKDWEPPPKIDPTEVPYDYSFHVFRQHIGWQSNSVIGELTVAEVEWAYRVRQLEIKFGMT